MKIEYVQLPVFVLVFSCFSVRGENFHGTHTETETRLLSWGSGVEHKNSAREQTTKQEQKTLEIIEISTKEYRRMLSIHRKLLQIINFVLRSHPLTIRGEALFNCHPFRQ